MKRKYELAYMRMALAFAETSEAVRKKVGALIVNPDGGIVAEGINGMPPGWDTEVCEDYNFVDHNEVELVTKKECRHAETAALEKLWSSPCTSKGCYMFITLSPCLGCAIKIKTAGITKVYYNEQYRDTAGLDFLRKAGIVVEQITLEENS